MSKAHRGTGNVYQRGQTWWVQYCWRGQVHRQSSGSHNRADAVRLLKRKLGEIGQGRLISPDVERTTFDDLADMLLTDYRVNGKRSLGRIEDAVEHLRGQFSLCLALDIAADRIASYIAARQAEGAANGTINRELSALRRMLRLAERAGKVAHRPYIEMLRENNTRTGFFEPEQFKTVLSHLPPALQPIMHVAYITGWRVRSEILTRTWAHVDFEGGWLRLEPGETKNGEGRQFPLIPDLRALLKAQRDCTDTLARHAGRIVPWVFHRNGKPVKDLYTSWRLACRKAGLPGKLQHDFRRTAVRNLERAGVSRSAAMKMVGHKTEAIYRRYAIVAEADLREGGQKLAALHQRQASAERPQATVK